MKKPRGYDYVGGGGDGVVDAEQLAALKGEVAEWNLRSGRFWERRLNAENVRRCRWAGQSLDGRLWAENFGNKVPSPFDGASDQRVRWADALVREKVDELVVALARAQPRCEGRGRGDGARAGRLTKLLRWMLDVLGMEWERQWRILVNYAWGDSPAVAGMGVEWVQEWGLELREVSTEELRELYVARAMMEPGADEEVVARAGEDFIGALVDERWGEDELTNMVMEFFPDLRAGRARRVVAQVRRGGVAEFPYPVVVYEGPRVRALRYGDDFVVPDSATDFRRVSPWFRVRWMCRAELEAMVTDEGWSRDFVDEVLEQEGVACLDEWGESGKFLAQVGPEARKGLYQVVEGYWRGVDEDGVAARYMAVFHTGCEGTAFGRRMVRDAHGGWPVVFYQADVMSEYLLDGEGVPERVGPLQGAMKQILDSATDANTIWSLPPILSHGIEQHGDAYLEPLKVIRGKRDAKFEPMRGPQALGQGGMVTAELKALRDWEHGRPMEGEEGGAGRAALRRECDMLWFLGHVREVCRMLVALARQYGSDELLARVMDVAGDDGAMRAREDIGGEYSVRMVFDPGDLDFGGTRDRLQVVRDLILGMDGGRSINTAVVAQSAFRAVFPYMAEDAVREVQEGDEDEVRDEGRNLALIRAGVMPKLDVEGNWNYELRRRWYDGLMEENPAVFDDMGPDKKQILAEWLRGLEQQAVQFGRNVEVGRTGMASGAGAAEGE